MQLQIHCIMLFLEYRGQKMHNTAEKNEVYIIDGAYSDVLLN